MGPRKHKADAKKKREPMKIAKNDTVIVIGGDYRYRGRTGKVLKVFPKTKRIIVEKVRFVKRHTRAMLQQGQQGGILEKEAPIHVSNVVLLCSKCNRPVRIGTQMKDGARVRVCRNCGEVVD